MGVVTCGAGVSGLGMTLGPPLCMELMKLVNGVKRFWNEVPKLNDGVPVAVLVADVPGMVPGKGYAPATETPPRKTSSIRATAA